MATIKAFITRHQVATYFALTFTISWGGVLLIIGGPAGMTGINRTGSLFVGMLMHVSITATTLILTPQTTGASARTLEP